MNAFGSRTLKTLLSWIAFSAALGGTSCGKLPTTPATQKAAVLSNLSAEKIYPHPSDWKSSGTHGTYFEKSKISCKTCHGEDLQGGTAKVSCAQCHAGFPHPSNYRAGTIHGPDFLKSSSSCKTCHGPDLKGGGVKRGCTECHNQFPHAGEFKSTRLHGQIFRETPRSCSQCHGEDLTGGISQVSCNSCHKAYPHSEEFKKTPLHGNNYFQDRKQCAGCHGADHQGGTVQISCQSCHAFPHPEKWAIPSNHGQAFVDGLKSATPKPVTCVNCHNESPEKGVKKNSPQNFVSCRSCHKSFPHSENWKKEHGPAFLSDRSTCRTCHGPDLKGGVVGKSCNSCHEKYPHPEDWRQPTQHGANYVAGLDYQREAGTKKPKDNQCLFCHSARDPEPHPLSAQKVSCGKCHVGMPHDKKMPDGSGEMVPHYSVFQSLDKKGRVALLTQCFRCHTALDAGINRRNLPYSSGCNLCHGEPVIKGQWKMSYDENGNPVLEGDANVELDKLPED